MSSATLLVEGATLWVRKNQGDSAHLHSPLHGAALQLSPARTPSVMTRSPVKPERPSPSSPYDKRWHLRRAAEKALMKRLAGAV